VLQALAWAAMPRIPPPFSRFVAIRDRMAGKKQIGRPEAAFRRGRAGPCRPGAFFHSGAADSVQVAINSPRSCRILRWRNVPAGGSRVTRKTALITGSTGQDGAYLAEFLLDKGYVVHGVKRRASSFNTERVDHLYVDPHEAETRFFLHYGDLTDATNLIRLVQETQPDEIYNLAAHRHVQVSIETQ